MILPQHVIDSLKRAHDEEDTLDYIRLYYELKKLNKDYPPQIRDLLTELMGDIQKNFIPENAITKD